MNRLLLPPLDFKFILMKSATEFRYNIFRMMKKHNTDNNLNVNLLINDTNWFSKLSFIDFSI